MPPLFALNSSGNNNNGEEKLVVEDDGDDEGEFVIYTIMNVLNFEKKYSV